MRRWAIVLSFFIAIGASLSDAARADSYAELKACLRNCIDTTEPLTKARFLCVLDCYAAYADQKVSLNISIASSSTGYLPMDLPECPGPQIQVNLGAMVTVNFDISSGDNLESIDLILVDDDNNPADPAFGTLVGTDSNGGDGWSITFDSTPFGDFSGVLVAEAHFTGHNEEVDGDQAVIRAGTLSLCIPTVSEWGLAVLTLALLCAGTIVLGFRRQAVLAAEGTTATIGTRSTFVAGVFTKVLAITLAATAALLAGATFLFGRLSATDIGGAFATAIVLAYLIHLWVLLRRQ